MVNGEEVQEDDKEEQRREFKKVRREMYRMKGCFSLLRMYVWVETDVPTT